MRCYKDDSEDTLEDDDEQLAFIVRSFKKMFRRSENHVRQPFEQKKNSFDPKKRQQRKCFFCGDPNHMISDCLKRKGEKAYIGGAWDDEEVEAQEEEAQEKCLMAFEDSLDTHGIWCDDEHEETCLVGQDDDKVQTSPSIDNTKPFISRNEFERLCYLSTKVSSKNSSLKEEIKFKKKINELKRINENVLKENHKQVKPKSQACLTCDDFRQENHILLNRIKALQGKELSFSKFDKSGEILNDILKVQKTPNDKLGLGFSNNLFSPSTNTQKSIYFVKSKDCENKAEEFSVDPRSNRGSTAEKSIIFIKLIVNICKA